MLFCELNCQIIGLIGKAIPFDVFEICDVFSNNLIYIKWDYQI